MARRILAELVVRLTDAVSSDAKKAVAGLKGIEKAAVDFANRTKGLDGWGSRFSDRLARLGANAGEIDKLRSSWSRLNDAVRGGDAAFRSNAIRSWQASSIAAMAAVRREAERTAGSIDKLSMRRFGRNALILAGGVPTAYGAQRGIRRGARVTGEAVREDYRQHNAGLSVQDRLAISARSVDLSRQYPSVDITKLREMGAGAKNAFGNIGEALDILPALAQARVALQTAKPDQVDGQMERLMKALDIMGRTENPDRTRVLFDGFVKAVSVEREQLNFDDILKFAKHAKGGAGGALSPEFLTAIAPTMMQQTGGSTAGTQLGTALMALTGNKMKKQARGALAAAGLYKNGKMVDNSTLVSNPFEWAQRNLMPVMAKKGIDVEGLKEGDTDRGMKARVEALKSMAPFFSDRNVLSLFNDFITNFPQYSRNVEQYRNARGLEQADEARHKDPFVALEASVAQTRNAIAALGEAASPTATKALNSFADWMNKFAGTVRDNPKASEELIRHGAVPAVGLASIGAGSALSGVGGIAGGVLAPALLAGGAAAFLGGWVYAGRQKHQEVLEKLKADAAKGKGPAASPLWRYNGREDFTHSPEGQSPGFRSSALWGGMWPMPGGMPHTALPTARGIYAGSLDPAAGASLGTTVATAADVFGTTTSSVSALGEAAAKAGGNAGGLGGVLHDLAAAAASAAGSLRSLVGRALEGRAGATGDVPSPASAPGRWAGGHVSAGSLYRVGEVGPEWFSPGVDGHVFDSLPRLGAAAQAPNVTNSFSVVVHGVQGQDPDDLAEHVIRRIKDQVDDSIRGLFADFGTSIA